MQTLKVLDETICMCVCMYVCRTVSWSTMSLGEASRIP